MADAPPAADTLSAAGAPSAAPLHILVVSDRYGFVGAFRQMATAQALVLHKYTLIPFLIQRFQTRDAAGTSVWVVPYRETDAVAFASTDRAEAEAAQKALLDVGLTYGDSVDHWEADLDTVAPVVAERLAAMSQAHQMYVGGAGAAAAAAAAAAEKSAAATEALFRANAPRADGPIAKLLRETERCTIFDCVAPTAVVSGDPLAGDFGPEAVENLSQWSEGMAALAGAGFDPKVVENHRQWAEETAALAGAGPGPADLTEA
jgi:hypothetical protein